MTASFAEIEEQEATGETAAIYADLRGTLQLPFVNLIWRHFPTIPGALPAMWDLLKPLYGSAQLERGAAALRATAELPGLETLPAAVWDGAGVGASQRADITRVIEEYNRANAVNFLAMATATIVLRGDGVGGGMLVTPATGCQRPSASEMRPLPSLSALDPPMLALVKAVDGLGRLGKNDALASLYRHLSYWPPFLSMAYGALLPFDRSGAIHVTQQALVAKGRSIAREHLLPLASADFSLVASSREQALTSMDDFTSLMIGRMNVMGAALRVLVP